MNDFGLDDEIIAFIDRYLEISRGMPSADSIEQQRRNYDDRVQQLRYPYPPEIGSCDSSIQGRHGAISLRHYRYRSDTSAARLLFIHGGGFILGNLESYDDICAEICAATKMNLTSITYRLSPEFLHPVHLDDIEDAFDGCYQPGLVIIGVSAGGTLAAALAHRLKSAERKPGAQLLIYPGLGGESFDLPSYRSNAQAPLLTSEDIDFYRKIRCDGDTGSLQDPEFYPLLGSDYSGLPKTVAISADIDPLRDDAELYVERLTAARVDARWINEAGLVHDFLRARHVSSKAGAAFRRICETVKELAN